VRCIFIVVANIWPVVGRCFDSRWCNWNFQFP